MYGAFSLCTVAVALPVSPVNRSGGRIARSAARGLTGGQSGPALLPFLVELLNKLTYRWSLVKANFRVYSMPQHCRGCGLDNAAKPQP